MATTHANARRFTAEERIAQIKYLSALLIHVHEAEPLMEPSIDVEEGLGTVARLINGHAAALTSLPAHALNIETTEGGV